MTMDGVLNRRTVLLAAGAAVAFKPSAHAQTRPKCVVSEWFLQSLDAGYYDLREETIERAVETIRLLDGVLHDPAQPPRSRALAKAQQDFYIALLRFAEKSPRWSVDIVREFLEKQQRKACR